MCRRPRQRRGRVVEPAPLQSRAFPKSIPFSQQGSLPCGAGSAGDNLKTLSALLDQRTDSHLTAARSSACLDIGRATAYAPLAMTSSDAVLRLLLAAGLGAALGLEREYRQKPAGLRTNMLIAVGAALFTEISTIIAG